MVKELVNFVLQLINPTYIIQNGGLWLLLATVIAENGFFFGFFLPLCLGLIHFNLRSFTVYKLVGALVWASSLVLADYFLKATFPEVIHYIEWIVLFIAFNTCFPLVYQYFKHRRISFN
jgi:membrane protein DedA with SNARE-associated domain